jgi:hypothetical protein
MPAAINEVATVSNEIVLAERVVTNEWRVSQIHENVLDRYVRADIELGPFDQDGTRPDGTPRTRGRSNRSIVVWQNDEYDVMRDAWTNADLLQKIQTILES